MGKLLPGSEKETTTKEQGGGGVFRTVTMEFKGRQRGLRVITMGLRVAKGVSGSSQRVLRVTKGGVKVFKGGFTDTFSE